MASAYFTFPALLVIYAAQRAAELRTALGGPRLVTLPKAIHFGALRPVASA